MIINLTKLLKVPARVTYKGILRETNFTGKLKNGTSENSPYSFELEEENDESLQETMLEFEKFKTSMETRK